MNSFEQMPRPAQVEPNASENSVEVSGLEPEKAREEERGVLSRFQGKAKRAASVLMLMTALSAAPGLISEAYAGQKKDTNTEQTANRESIENFTFSVEAPWYKFNGTDAPEKHSFKMMFHGQVRELLAEQGIEFNQKDGSFKLPDGKKISVDEATSQVDVRVMGASNVLQIKATNLDGSTDAVLLQNGRIIGGAKVVK